VSRRRTDDQLSLVCEGLMPDETPAEEQMADVFAVWVERIAELNAAIAEHDAQRRDDDHRGSHLLPDGTCCHCGPANLNHGPRWACTCKGAL